MTLLLSLLLACSGAPSPGTGVDSGGSDGGSDVDGDAGSDDSGDACPDSLQWETAAAPLLLTACAPCHSAGRVGEERHGAPEDVDLDSLAAAVSNGERALARLDLGDMPPAGGVSDVQRERFRQWLACGAPGDATPRPAATDRVQVGFVGEIREEVLVDSSDPSLLLIATTFAFEANPWRVERYLLGAGDLWLVSIEHNDEAGSLQREDRFDPPLALLSAGGPAGLVDTHWTRTEAGSVQEADQHWEVTVAPGGFADPFWALDTDAVELLALEDEGAVIGLVLSDILGVTQRLWIDPDGAETAMLLTMVVPPPDGGDGPISAGRDWLGRVYDREAP